MAALYRQPASIFQIDEFGKFLASVVNRKSAPRHLAEIWDHLTELSTSAGGTFFGAEYADQKQRPRQDIVQPCCCVHATTVPEPFWAALQSGSLHDGSLARFLIFQTDDDIPDRTRHPRPVGDVPEALVVALQAIAAGVPGHARGNIAGAVDGPIITPEPYPVPMSADAEAMFDRLDAETTARQRSAAKVALIKAVAANPTAPEIILADAGWARLVVARCVGTLLIEAERHLADNETERNHKRVLEIIRSAGRRGITKKQLYDRTRFLSRRDREDVLTTLIESERISLEVRKTATKPIITYRVDGS